MKKLILFISSLIFFLGCFIGLGLDSFAYDSDFSFPTAGVTISISHEKYSSSSLNYYDYELQSIYPIVFIKLGSAATDVNQIYSPLEYGRYRQRHYSDPNGTIPDWGDWSTISWSAETHQVDGENVVLYRGNISFSNYGSPSLTNVIVFNSFESAYRYFQDPENPDNIDNVVNEDGKEIIQGSLIPDVDWGSNGSPSSVGGVPDTYNIPAPQFNISYDSNGNVMHSITFTNFEYDSRRQDGKYGLVLSASWATFDDFSLVHTGSLFDTTYTVTYGTAILDEPVFEVYSIPQKVTDIQYCPQSLNFNQNTISLNAFNTMISNNPVNSRTVNVPASEPNDILENQFKEFLSKVNCPYNYLVFSCFYYKPNGDGTYSFGPTTTGAFYPPNQGAVYSAGRFNGQDGSMQPGSGGGAGGNGGNWNNNWGNGNTNINLDYGSQVDPQQLVNNMNSLLGFIGNVPNFVTQLFSFLPEWLIIFIAVSIGLMVAIGVVKLFLG